MEIADGYKPLYDFINNNNNNRYDFDTKENYKCMAKLQLFKMAKYAEYLHNDFHADNILVNPNYDGIYEGTKGKVLLIDFGFSTPINKNNKNITDYLNINNYQGFFNYYYLNLTRPDGYKFTDRTDLYKWIFNSNYNESNKYIEFFQQQEIKKNQIKQTESEGNYPLNNNELQKYNYDFKIPEILRKINVAITLQSKTKNKNFMYEILKKHENEYAEKKRINEEKKRRNDDSEEDDDSGEYDDSEEETKYEEELKKRRNYELKNYFDDNKRKKKVYEGGKSQL